VLRVLILMSKIKPESHYLVPQVAPMEVVALL
jgi:hypothetical protein